MAEPDIFALLDGASPWWWVALSVAIGVAEMLTFSYFLIWPALAALAVGGALWLAPELGGGVQLAIFAVLAVLFTVAGRVMLSRRRPAGGGARLNRRAAQMIGRTAKALSAFEHGEGVLLIDGVRWAARLSEGEAKAGDALRVVGADGMTLICTPA
ncbi:NfeD family protein [Pikeienuella sp. HZG-20]|uniref:NfeD family protein n=1 Tax=Paludibacillus litoralis TaxID=3133267 RepID=UPI0030EF55DE